MGGKILHEITTFFIISQCSPLVGVMKKSKQGQDPFQNQINSGWLTFIKGLLFVGHCSIMDYLIPHFQELPMKWGVLSSHFEDEATKA